MNLELGYVRVLAMSPRVRVADVATNTRAIIDSFGECERAGADIVLFPELSLTGYTCGDLFQQETLLGAAVGGLDKIVAASERFSFAVVVGLPLRVQGQLFNCAAVVHCGMVLGVVPKSVLPNYKEYYEQRWFSPASHSRTDEVVLNGAPVPFGNDLVFSAINAPDFCFGVEICEDLWAPVPPSTRLALGGATVLLNISASDELVGKAAYRRDLVTQQSGRCLAAYAYCSSGVHESTTDLVFGGHCLMAENGVLLAESERFGRDSHSLVADVDIQFLMHERTQNNTFNSQECEPEGNLRRILFEADVAKDCKQKIERTVAPLPFVPSDLAQRHERCREIFAIQSSGLATRLENSGIEHAVIGLSGGLDSTLALLVTVEAFERLGLPHQNIHGVTMPGFGTSERTLNNVNALCEAMGVSLETVDIRAACEQHLTDIGHGGDVHDVTYENVQARERTQILMDKANLVGGLVVGTGDLSELALGWCTYNADHMSMYGVNCGVPKTLVAFLIEYVAESWDNARAATVLRDVLETPISPELLPADAAGEIAQKTEEIIGPYELHDFFLYHLIRRGCGPVKVVRLAEAAFDDRYSRSEIKKWMRGFITRFFRHQFKRSCMPDGPKVGTIALSPRGDWRMPSDASPAVWLSALDAV
jgi:NAD+ synthase (glutamine-hydrolysing)